MGTRVSLGAKEKESGTRSGVAVSAQRQVDAPARKAGGSGAQAQEEQGEASATTRAKEGREREEQTEAKPLVSDTGFMLEAGEEPKDRREGGGCGERARAGMPGSEPSGRGGRGGDEGMDMSKDRKRLRKLHLDRQASAADFPSIPLSLCPCILVSICVFSAHVLVSGFSIALRVARIRV